MAGAEAAAIDWRLEGRFAVSILRHDRIGTRRGQQAFRGGLTSLFARGLSISAGLITLPIALSALGREMFGIYLTITTLLALLSFLNLGLGNGLVTTLARAESRENTTEVQRLVSTSLALSGGAALVATVVAVAAVRGLPWPTLLGASGAVSGEVAESAVLVAVLCTLANVPASIAASVRLGLQESAVANLWMGASGLLQVAGVAFAASASARLPVFVGALAAPPLICNLANSVQLYSGRRAHLRPRLRSVDLRKGWELLNRGSLFVVLGLAGAVAFQTDVLVLSHVLGPAAVAEYGVPFRLFSLLPLVVSLLVFPLWPAYADASARSEHDWVRRVLRNSLGLAGAISIVAGATLVIAAPFLISLWVGGVISPGIGLLVALGAYAVVQSISAPLSMYLNGAGVVGFQVVVAGSMALLNLPLSIVLAQSIGVAGPVLASVIAQSICVLVPCAVFIPRHLARFGNAS